MGERKIEVRPYMVEKLCPKCGTAMVYDANVVLAVYPTRYSHRCPQCGWVEDYGTPYPRVKYEIIEPEEASE